MKWKSSYGLDLRPLVSRRCVLDCELVQAEVPAHLAHQLRRRVVELDPDVVPTLARHGRRFLDGELPLLAHSMLVVRAVDDHVPRLGAESDVLRLS